jgi:hypothetical protein
VNFRVPVSSISVRAIAPHLFSKKTSSRSRRSRLPLSTLNQSLMSDHSGLTSPQSAISDPPLPDDTRSIRFAEADAERDLCQVMRTDSRGNLVVRRASMRSDSSCMCSHVNVLATAFSLLCSVSGSSFSRGPGETDLWNDAPELQKLLASAEECRVFDLKIADERRVSDLKIADDRLHQLLEDAEERRISDLKIADERRVSDLKIAEDRLHWLLEKAEGHRASDQMVADDHFLKIKYS